MTKQIKQSSILLIYSSLSIRRRELKANEWKVVLLTYLVGAHHDAPSRALR